MKIIFLILSFVLVLSICVFAQNVTVNISGIRNNDGVMQLSIFEDAQQFKDEKPSRNITIEKGDISKGEKIMNLKLDEGVYAITVLDDEDMSGNMSFRFLVYPLEGVGFSNFMLNSMIKPSFYDFDFSVSKNSNVDVIVKMKYF